VFTNFCESAAYIRVIPSISSSTLVFSYWSTTDWASTGWPAPDGCGHSTLRWALYGKRWFTGSWQLLTDPGTGLAANTAIYGTPPAQSKGFCEHSYWNTPTAPIDYGPRFIWMPAAWWARAGGERQHDCRRGSPGRVSLRHRSRPVRATGVRFPKTARIPERAAIQKNITVSTMTAITVVVSSRP
jgi:hypothetical protein